FTYDVSKPTTAVTNPSGPWTKNLSLIEGTASDKRNNENNPSGFSASGVRVAFKQISNNKWWNGVNFTADSNPNYFTATLSHNATYWSYDASGVGWTSGERY